MKPGRAPCAVFALKFQNCRNHHPSAEGAQVSEGVRHSNKCGAWTIGVLTVGCTEICGREVKRISLTVM